MAGAGHDRTEHAVVHLVEALRGETQALRAELSSALSSVRAESGATAQRSGLALEDVRGKRSAQSNTSSFAELAREAGAQVEAVEGFTQAITLLKQGRVDVTINDSLAFLEYQKSTGDEDVKIAAEIDQPSEQALVFRKNSADLQARVDEALTALRADGTLARISEKYFGEDVSGE